MCRSLVFVTVDWIIIRRIMSQRRNQKTENVVYSFAGALAIFWPVFYSSNFIVRIVVVCLRLSKLSDSVRRFRSIQAQLGICVIEETMRTSNRSMNACTMSTWLFAEGEKRLFLLFFLASFPFKNFGMN